MASDMLKDTILEKLAEKKQGGAATIIELMGRYRDQELLESRIVKIGNVSGLNTIVIKITLIGNPQRIVKLFHLNEGKLEQIWVHYFRRYGKEIRNKIVEELTKRLRNGRNLIIIDFVTNPDLVKKLGEYLRLMKMLFRFLKTVNNGNDLFIIIREREVKIFKEQLSTEPSGKPATIDKYEIIDDIH